jgi:SAM-dependent methyltransferase
MPFWDDRYAEPGFAYGTEPNAWLVRHAARIPPGGRVLSLGEGEGRNAVWLAERGLIVEAVDSSPIALAKARHLAASRGVAISTVVADVADYRPSPATYDAVVLVFLHLPPPLRRAVHAAAAAALKPGGVLIIEAFTPRQLAYSSGGPRQAELLYEPVELERDFPGMTWERFAEEEVALAEGAYHHGQAAVVRGVGRRTG